MQKLKCSFKLLKIKLRSLSNIGWLICAIGALFYCYEFVLRILPGALQSELSVAFGHISASTFGQLSALYYFAYSPMQMPVGMLIDRFGAKKLLSMACLCCTLGTFLFSCYSHLFIAGVGRFLVGFGSAFAFVGMLSLATVWLPKRFFSLAAGLMTTMGMLGLVYGEVKLKRMATTVGVNHALMALVIVGIFLTVVIFLCVKDAPVRSETKVPSLLVFFKEVCKVLMSSEVWLIGFYGACLYTSLSVFGELWGKTYLEQAHHLTKLQAAETLSYLFIGWAIGAPLSGYFSDHSGRRTLPLVVNTVLALICILPILYYPGLSQSALKILVLFYGIFSGAEIIVFAMAKERCGVSLSGTVFAAINMIVTLGGVILQPTVGWLLDWSAQGQTLNGEHVYSLLNYQVALSVLPISLITLVISSFCFRKNR